MLISVIVPIYGVENYIRACVDSIINQTYSRFEIILVDDGSKDKCPSICDDYARLDSRVKVIHKKNGGLVSARKAGMKVAKGDYILNVDGDDYIDSDLFLNLSKIVKTYNPDIIDFGFFKVEDKTNRIMNIQKHNSDLLIEKKNNNEIRQRYLYDSKEPGLNDGLIPHAIWCKLVRRNVYVEAQEAVCDKITKGEDMLFTLKLLQEPCTWVLSSLVGYNYRYRSESMINSLKKNDFEKLYELLNEIKKIVKDELMDEQICIYIYRRINSLASSAIQVTSGYETFARLVEGASIILNDEFMHKPLKMKNLKMSDKVLLLIIRKKLWRLYYAYKILFRKFR